MNKALATGVVLAALTGAGVFTLTNNSTSAPETNAPVTMERTALAAIALPSDAALAVDEGPPQGEVIFRWSTNVPVRLYTTDGTNDTLVYTVLSNNNCTVTSLAGVTNSYKLLTTYGFEVPFDTWPPVAPSSVTVSWNWPHPDTNATNYRVYQGHEFMRYDSGAFVGNTSQAILGYPSGGFTMFYAATVSNNVMESGTQAYPVSAWIPAKTAPVENLTTPVFASILSYTYSWPRVPGVTNTLQGSSDLRSWTAVKSFTSGTASVTITNPLNFHRVLLVKPTNSPAITLTQAVAQVALTWTGSANQVLERSVDAATGSFTPVYTNATSTNTITLVQPPGYYRLAPWK